MTSICFSYNKSNLPRVLHVAFRLVPEKIHRSNLLAERKRKVIPNTWLYGEYYTFVPFLNWSLPYYTKSHMSFTFELHISNSRHIENIRPSSHKSLPRQKDVIQGFIQPLESGAPLVASCIYSFKPSPPVHNGQPQVVKPSTNQSERFLWFYCDRIGRLKYWSYPASPAINELNYR